MVRAWGLESLRGKWATRRARIELFLRYPTFVLEDTRKEFVSDTLLGLYEYFGVPEEEWHPFLRGRTHQAWVDGGSAHSLIVQEDRDSLRRRAQWRYGQTTLAGNPWGRVPEFVRRGPQAEAAIADLAQQTAPLYHVARKAAIEREYAEMTAGRDIPESEVEFWQEDAIIVADAAFENSEPDAVAQAVARYNASPVVEFHQPLQDADRLTAKYLVWIIRNFYDEHGGPKAAEPKTEYY